MALFAAVIVFTTELLDNYGFMCAPGKGRMYSNPSKTYNQFSFGLLVRYRTPTMTDEPMSGRPNLT